MDIILPNNNANSDPTGAPAGTPALPAATPPDPAPMPLLSAPSPAASSIPPPPTAPLVVPPPNVGNAAAPAPDASRPPVLPTGFNSPMPPASPTSTDVNTAPESSAKMPDAPTQPAEPKMKPDKPTATPLPGPELDKEKSDSPPPPLPQTNKSKSDPEAEPHSLPPKDKAKLEAPTNGSNKEGKETQSDKTASTEPTAKSPESVAYTLLEDLHLTDIAEDKKQALMQRITALVDQEVLYAVMSRLSDEDVKDLEAHLSEQKDPASADQQAYDFLVERLPNLRQVVDDAMVAVYDRLKDSNAILQS